MLAGWLAGEEARLAHYNNRRIPDAMSACVDYPDALAPQHAPAGPERAMHARHLACVLVLLRAGCKLNHAQLHKVQAALARCSHDAVSLVQWLRA